MYSDPTPGSPAENSPAGTGPVTATPCAVRSNDSTASIERTTTISARGNAGNRYRISSNVARQAAPSAKVVRFVSGSSLMVPHSCSM